MIQFTPLEFEILKHRLDVPECIAEAIEADFDQVYTLCAVLRTPGTWTPELLALRMVKDILQDAVDGSTYCGTVSDESPHKAAAVRRAAVSLAAKISKIIGRQVEAVLF